MKYLLILLACLLTLANSEPLFQILSNELDSIDPYQIAQPVQIDESILKEELDNAIDETNEVIPAEDVNTEILQEDEIINSVEDVNGVETLENSSLVELEATIAKPFFVELYEVGKKSYLSNDFKNCVSSIEDALKSYAEYTSAILACKVKCNDEAENDFVPMAAGRHLFLLLLSPVSEPSREVEKIHSVCLSVMNFDINYHFCQEIITLTCTIRRGV